MLRTTGLQQQYTLFKQTKMNKKEKALSILKMTEVSRLVSKTKSEQAIRTTNYDKDRYSEVMKKILNKGDEIINIIDDFIKNGYK